MPDSFGARLRRRREEKGIDLDAIAERTKIKRSLLDALERDDVRCWPTGIFRRAFIRSYAQAIDLDADGVVREFLELYPDPEVEPAAAIPASAGGRVNGGGFRGVVGAAFDSIARSRRSAPVSDLAPEPSAPPAPAPLAAPSPLRASAPAPLPPPPAETGGADLLAIAQLCTRFSRVDNVSALRELLQEAVGLLHATGLIVWVWDTTAAELRPTLALGYPARVVAQLPPVKPDADNATAAAFRSAQPCAIDGHDSVHGALAVPLMTPAGCSGVLAIELNSEPTASVRATGMILGAVLSQLVVSA